MTEITGWMELFIEVQSVAILKYKLSLKYNTLSIMICIIWDMLFYIDQEIFSDFCLFCKKVTYFTFISPQHTC